MNLQFAKNLFKTSEEIKTNLITPNVRWTS